MIVYKTLSHESAKSFRISLICNDLPILGQQLDIMLQSLLENDSYIYDQYILANIYYLEP